MKTNIITLAVMFIGITLYAQNNNDYQYDNLNRLKKVTFPNGTVYDYSYDQLGNRTVKVTTSSAPTLSDLVVQNQSLSQTTLSVGASTNVSCRIANIGQGGAGGHFVKFYLSANQTYEQDTDVEIGSVYNSAIAAGSNLQTSTNITIPQGTTPGTWYVLFVADATNLVTESNENNNIENIAITVVNCNDMQLSTVKTDAKCGNSDGTASVNVSGGNQPYTYQWSNGQTSESINNLAANTYFVTVTDYYGCSANTSVTVSTIEPPSLSMSSTNATCGLNNGSASVTVTGGTAPYQYLWSNGQTTATNNNLVAGNYSVTVTDANSCTISSNIIIHTPDSLTVVLYPTNPTCGSSNGTISCVVSGGTSPFTFLWSNGQTEQTAINLAAGTYSLTVTDTNNCQFTTNTVLSSLNSMSLSVSTTNSTCDNANGTATVNASNGTAPYTYIWSNGQTSQTATNLASGAYNVTVTDANNCSTITYATVEATLPPSVFVTSTETSCSSNTGTATATVTNGTTPYTYLWSDGQTTQTATGLGAGMYSVTVTDESGCTANSNITVQYQQQGGSVGIPTNGLVAHYPFNGNANDESGNSNHGTVNGATLTTDRFGNVNSAYSFAGISNPQTISVTNSSSLQFTNAATFSLWVKMNSYQGMDGWGQNVSHGYHVLFAKDFDNCCLQAGIAGLTNGQFSVHIGTGNGGNSVWDTVPNSALNQWINITFVITTTNISIFADGNLIASQDGTMSFTNSNTKDLWFGRFSSHWYPFNGVIDDIRVYNRALNSAEIKAIYNLGNGGVPTNGLIAHYPFNGNANDESGNNLHGTIHNNVILTTDRHGNANSAYYFSGGTYDWIEVANNSLLNLGPDFTVSTWVYKESGSNNYVLGKGRDITCGSWQLGTPSISVDGSCGISASNSIPINNDQWVMLTGVLNSSTGKLRYYQDGQMITEVNSNPFTGNNTFPFAIGRHITSLPVGSSWPYPFKGKIDDILIYNRPLSDAEIQQLYQGTTVSPELSVNLGADTVICEDALHVLDAGAGFNSYVWSTGSSAQTIQLSNLNAGIHEFSVQVNACGSVGYDTILVTVNPLPSVAGTITGSTTICQGQSSVTYTVPEINNATSYIWTLPNGATGTSTTNSIIVDYDSSAVSGYITVKGHNYCGDGDISTLAITVNPLPIAASTITGSTTVCEGTSQTYSVTNESGVTYNWTFPANWTQTEGGTTNSVTVTVGSENGNITVTPSNSCGNGTASTLEVTTLTTPTQPSTITGTTDVCEGTSQTYSVTNESGVTYNWTFPANWTQTEGGTTNSVTVTVGSENGNITVTPSNSCGNGTASTLEVTTLTTPTQPSTITGTTDVCEGTSQTYSVTNESGVTYNWTFPADWIQTEGGTTNSVTVTVGSENGNITVTPSNSCGNGTASTLEVTTLTTPTQPSTITGTTDVCEGSSQTYSVTNESGVTYNWTFPADWIQTEGGTTNSVTVTVGSDSGNITVTPSNSCGNGTARTLEVTTLTTPAQPSAITGTTDVCEGTSQTYSVTNESGVTYNWTFPTGWIQTEGGTTNSVTVTVGSESGNITVTPSNSCGNGIASTLEITTLTTPAQPSNITGAADVCEGTSQTYSVINESGVTYNWTFPTDWTQTEGGTTNSVTVTVGSDSGNITVTPSNSCGNGTARTLEVTTLTTPTQPSAITGATDVCEGTSQTYSVTNESGVTYNWTFPADWTQTEGGTTNLVTVTVGSDSGNITVTPSNLCGNGTVRTLEVTTLTTPTQPSTITGTTDVCEGTSQTYSVTDESGVTYNWTFPADWIQTEGGTTNSVTVTVGSDSGNIIVTPSNSCGDGTARTLEVSSNPIPQKPSITQNGNILTSDAPKGNQWYNQHGIIEDAINQTHTVTVNGTYYVIVTLNGCSSEPSDTLNINIIGIESAEFSKNIKIYPNPVSNELIIEIKGNNKEVNFDILNTKGQVVFTGTLVEKTTIQTNSFAHGVYLIKLENGSTFEFKKIIKQ